MVYELKKVGGDRMEDAVEQTINAVVETMDQQGQVDHAYDVFLVVQRGLDIAFFEYHSDVSNLEEQDTSNFRGCTSFTQACGGSDPVITPPDNLKRLFFATDRLRLDTEIRQDAKAYVIPCVFNLQEHEKEISFLFQHLARGEPRPSF